MDFTVVEDWQASYPDPIRLQAGEALTLTGRQERWDGHLWLWARSAGGREGWVPDRLVRRTAAGCTATQDYSAAELTCRSGQRLTGETETHGWVFCRAADGAAGWVPRRNLAPVIG